MFLLFKLWNSLYSLNKRYSIKSLDCGSCYCYSYPFFDYSHCSPWLIIKKVNICLWGEPPRLWCRTSDFIHSKWSVTTQWFPCKSSFEVTLLAIQRDTDNQLYFSVLFSQGLDSWQARTGTEREDHP